jgi:hypothetical protein
MSQVMKSELILECLFFNNMRRGEKEGEEEGER